MGRILSISSQTVFGSVGNSAAVPAMQEHGHEVLALPTVLLSCHPGFGKTAGQVTPAPLLGEILQKLSHIGVLSSCAGVLTGYFAEAAQVLVVAEMISAMTQQNPHLHVLVDPVIGDDDALYVPEKVAAAIRDNLLPLATITTPNAFELSWLLSEPVKDEATAIAAARRLAVSETLVTSVPRGDSLSTCLVTSESALTHVVPRLTHVPHGTGDFLAGTYLAKRLTTPVPEAFDHSMRRQQQLITRSAGQSTLMLN